MLKIVIVTLALACAFQASPSPFLSLEATQKLVSLGLGLTEDIDYNQYITQLSDVVEKAEQVALFVIESAVSITSIYGKTLDLLGQQQATVDIHKIETDMFTLLEANRQAAFASGVDVTTCIPDIIQQIYSNADSTQERINSKLQENYNILDNEVLVSYVSEATSSLNTSCTVRPRIYQCPFKAGETATFYLCLVLNEVLQDVIILNDFTDNYNNTSIELNNQVQEYEISIYYFKDLYVNEFNATVWNLYDNQFVKCVADLGFNV